MPIPLPRRLAWILLACAAVGLGAALFDWNWLRRPLEHIVSNRLHREIRFDGPLEVHPWSAWPTFSAERVRIANFPGGRAESFADIGRVSIALDVAAALRGEWGLPSLQVEDARIHIEEDAAGQGNWPQGGYGSEAASLRFESVRIHNGRVQVDLPSRRSEGILVIDTEDATGRLHWQASGRWQDQRLEVSGESGSVRDVTAAGSPYPIAMQGRIGETRFAIEGKVTDLVRLEDMNVRFDLRGRSLAELYPLTGVPFPPTSAYRLQAQLSRRGGLWRFDHIDGVLGKSDVAGELAIDRTGEKQQLRADLRSRRLDLAELSGFIGGRAESGRAVPPPPGRVLPVLSLGFEKIAAADVDLNFAVGTIRGSRVPFEAASGRLRIDDRRVSLDGLKVGLAKGEIAGSLQLDARRQPAEALVDLQASRLHLRELMPPQAESQNFTSGSLDGRIRLVMAGNSVAQLLASAEGEVAVAMDGGSTSRLLMRLANLDIANGLIAWLAGGQKEQIRCLVGDLDARRGVLRPRTLFLDTEHMVVRAEGQVDFRDETLDLHLRSSPKDGSLVALRGPILISGTFARPSLAPEPLPLTARVAGSVVLGLVAPPLALLPLIETGGAKDSPCGKALRQTRKVIGASG